MTSLNKLRNVDKNTPAFELVFRCAGHSSVLSECPGTYECSHVINATSWAEAARWADEQADLCLRVVRLW